MLMRSEVKTLARKYRLPVHDVTELYDAFLASGMSEIDAASKALAITSVVNGIEIPEDLESLAN